MAFSTLTITNAGLALLAKVQTGNQLAFTKGQTGSGMLTEGQSIAAMTALVAPKQVAYVSKFLRLVSDKLTVGLIFNNLSLGTAYYWREIGLFATDPEAGEILFAYSNAGDAASYIPDSGSGTVQETVNLILSISNAADITITIDNTAVTPAWDDLTVNGIVPCTGTGTNTIAVSNPNISGYADGLKIALDMGVSANTGAATININGFGAKACRVQQPNGLTVSLTGGETTGITLWQYKAYGDSFVKLGERLQTISDTTAPTGDTGLLAKVLSWLATMIKAITGETSWRTTPAMSIKIIVDAITGAWVPLLYTWTMTDANKMYVSADLTGVVHVSDKIRYKIDGVNYKYGVVLAVTLSQGMTTLTIYGGSDYTISANSITDVSFSKAESPAGFAGWFNFAPSDYTGITAVTFSFGYCAIRDKMIRILLKYSCTLAATAQSSLSFSVSPVMKFQPIQLYTACYCTVGGTTVAVNVYPSSATTLTVVKQDGTTFAAGATVALSINSEFPLSR